MAWQDLSEIQSLLHHQPNTDKPCLSTTFISFVKSEIVLVIKMSNYVTMTHQLA